MINMENEIKTTSKVLTDIWENQETTAEFLFFLELKVLVGFRYEDKSIIKNKR